MEDNFPVGGVLNTLEKARDFTQSSRKIKELYIINWKDQDILDNVYTGKMQKYWKIRKKKVREISQSAYHCIYIYLFFRNLYLSFLQESIFIFSSRQVILSVLYFQALVAKTKQNR